MSRARTLKEIEDRKSRYSRYTWFAVVALLVGVFVGIGIYIALGLPNFFLADIVVSSLALASFLISVVAMAVGYLSKSGVVHGEYESAVRLSSAAIALNALSLALSLIAYTPPMSDLLRTICNTYAVAATAAGACFSQYYAMSLGGFGAYTALQAAALAFYYLARRTLEGLLAYYAPRRLK
ncbi:MAG: hypothetical protein TU35_003270 [Thermoproteus sp. AZ2]|jgi:hypothetical protein|uniref:Uncharacterized protein n=1 Tax=Thermoproteus sp. AZ2 TaxID=1609232 RepID=A0ACC6UZK9_9CREN|nr:MAG: hypothetical protein TU35_01940 [Thermoproteus sp. AZ2]